MVAISHFCKILYIVLNLHINTYNISIKDLRFSIWPKSIEALKFFSDLEFSDEIEEHTSSEKKLDENGDPHPENFINFLNLFI